MWARRKGKKGKKDLLVKKAKKDRLVKKAKAALMASTVKWVPPVPRAEKALPGPTAPPGAQGPAGAAGPAGPAGQVELVTCKTVVVKKKKKQQCTTKLVSGTVKFTATGSVARASLSRSGVVYATGSARRVHGRMRLVLRSSGYLAAGHYILTLVSGHGSREYVVNEAFTIK